MMDIFTMAAIEIAQSQEKKARETAQWARDAQTRAINSKRRNRVHEAAVWNDLITEADARAAEAIFQAEAARAAWVAARAAV